MFNNVARVVFNKVTRVVFNKVTRVVFNKVTRVVFNKVTRVVFNKVTGVVFNKDPFVVLYNVTLLVFNTVTQVALIIKVIKDPILLCCTSQYQTCATINYGTNCCDQIWIQQGFDSVSKAETSQSAKDKN